MPVNTTQRLRGGEGISLKLPPEKVASVVEELENQARRLKMSPEKKNLLDKASMGRTALLNFYKDRAKVEIFIAQIKMLKKGMRQEQAVENWIRDVGANRE